MRTLAKVVAVIVGVVVVLVVALVLLLQTSAVSNRVKDLVVPRASAALGREVTVKDAGLHLFPPRVALSGATVAGRPGEPALVDLEAFEVALALGPLVTSLGKEVRVTGIRLVKPVINLVRAKDGTWNYEGLGGAKEAKPAPAPVGEGQPNVVVDEARIEDGTVRLVDHAAGDKAAVALSHIDFAADHVGVGQPLHAKLSAAIAGPDKNFEAEIQASKLPASVAALGPGEWPALTGSLALTGLELARLRGFMPPSVTGTISGGRVDAKAKLTTQDAKYHVDGDGKLSQVRLRGQPAQGGFELHAVADPASGDAHAAIEKLSLQGPGVNLGGRVTYDAKPAAKVRFAIQGPLLDLGEVLALVPPSQEKEQQQGPLLTPELRKSVEALDVAGTIAIDKVQRGALVATGFKANAALEKGLFVLKDAGADFFAGHVDAGGTRLDLAQADPKWNLKAKLEGIDLGKALGALSGAAPVEGKMSGTLDLDGAGVNWEALKKALTGNGALSLKEGVLTTTDLGGKVLGAVSQGLQAIGKGGAAKAVGGAGGKTDLKDLAAQFTVKDGAMALSKPLSFGAPFGNAKLGGKIGLGGELGLQGTATIPKDVLAKVVSGVPLPSGLDVPLGLGGSLTAPSVNVDAQQAVAGLVRGAAQQQVKSLQDKAVGEGQKKAQDLLKGLGIGK